MSRCIELLACSVGNSISTLYLSIQGSTIQVGTIRIDPVQGVWQRSEALHIGTSLTIVSKDACIRYFLEDVEERWLGSKGAGGVGGERGGVVLVEEVHEWVVMCEDKERKKGMVL